MKKCIFIVVTLLSTVSSFAQIDTEFWFAVPWLSDHCWMADYHLVIFSDDKAANVTISMPADDTFTPIELHIDANGYTDYIIASDYNTAQAQLAVPIDVISKKALFIASTAPIYCYFQVTMQNGEAYTLKGRRALGTDFYVLSQNTLNNGGYSGAMNSVQILATEDNTTISISPIHAVGSDCSEAPFTIVLNTGETYAFRSCSGDASKHLHGTRITSDKPIAVNSSDDSASYGAGMDLAGDQLTPTDHWGMEYIAIGNNTDYETLTIIAKENDTQISVDDGSNLTLNQGESGIISMGSVISRFIQSNKPIGVWQLTGQSQEVGGTNLPGLRCTGSKVVKYKRSAHTLETFIHIVTNTDNVAHFTLNGSPIATSDFHVVNGTNSEYSYATIDVTNLVSGLIIVECSSGYFHMSAIDNTEDNGSVISSCTYGYFSDYRAAHEFYEYDTIPEGATYTWKGHYEADGVTERTFTESGYYSDIFTSQDGCDSICTLKLTVWHTSLGDTAVAFCSGESFTWHGVTYISSGDYYHTYKSMSGEDSIVTLHVTVLESTDSLEVATICAGETYTWHGQTFASSTTTSETLVNAAGCDSVCTLQLTVYPILTGDTSVTIIEGSSFVWWGETYTTTGDYTHTYTSQSTGCDSIVTLHLIVKSSELSYEIHTHPQCADVAFVEFELTAYKPIKMLAFAFSQNAKDQHFRDTVITYSEASILIPNGAKAGIYDVAISVTDSKDIIDTRDYQFTLLYPSSVLDQHWDDFIGVLTHDYNGGYDFVSFQWYKEGIPIYGETRSYLYQPLEMGKAYSAMLKEANGTQLMTCELIAVPQTEISLYPTLAQPNQMIQLHSSCEVKVWIYNAQGVLVLTQSFSKGEHQLTAPQKPGVYFIQIQSIETNGKTTVKKLLIK